MHPVRCQLALPYSVVAGAVANACTDRKHSENNDYYADRLTILDYFQLYITDELIDIIVTETNRYVEQTT